MKKVRFLLCGTLIFTIWACNKADLLEPAVKTDPAIPLENEVYETAESVGAWHNSCLNYLYDHFIALKEAEWTATEEEFDAELKGKILDYFTLTGHPAPDTEIPPGENFNHSYFSNEGESIVTQIEASIDDYEADLLTLEQFMDNMDEIQMAASSLDIEEERYIIAITASVAKYSALYWETDGLKYMNFYTEGNHEKASPAQIATLKQDAAGAFWGTVGGLATGNPVAGVFGGMFVAAYRSSVEGFRQKGYDCWFCP